MANQPVTPQQLIDAGVDAKTIEDAVNGAPEVEITSRLGRKFWTLATIDSRSQQLLSEFRDAVQTIVVDDGVPAVAVSTASDQNQQEINDFGGYAKYKTGRVYAKNQRVILNNGDIVRSTVDSNTTNPNIDMTGWVNFEADQKKINDGLLRDTYYARAEGFKTDGSDNLAAWNTLQAKLKAGDTVIFSTGTYVFSSSMNIEKIINIVGTGRIRGTKAILKFNSGGVVRKTAGIDIRDINIAGTQTTTVFDFDNRVFGNIGLKEQYDGVSDTSTCRLSSVTITGFDVGRVTAQEGTATWAGAYRDNTDVVIQRNRVGYVALDGATHERYVGGTISANTEIGIWAEAKNHNYNNIDFIGTTLEINGHQGNEFNSRDVLKSLNVFAGANTIINFIGSYNEQVVSIAKDGGIINKIGSYEHPNSYNFSCDGNINLVLSNSSHVSKLNMQNSLANLTASRTGGLSVAGVSDNHIRVTSSSQNLASFRSKEFKVTGVKNNEIRFIKLSFRYKFTGGFTANSQLNVQPLFFLRSSDGTTDTTTTNLAYPKQLLINSYDEWHTFEFFYRPRIVSGYLTPDDFLSSFDFRFIFYNGLDGTPNFSTDPLVCDISTVEVELFASKQARMNSGYKSAGTTAERPTLLATEQGVQYYNTETNSLEFWNGTQWVVVSTTLAP